MLRALVLLGALALSACDPTPEEMAATIKKCTALGFGTGFDIQKGRGVVAIYCLPPHNRSLDD